jgi:hypothetical protein
MTYSKVRWISMPTFLACVGSVHGRREGANVREGAYAPLRQAYVPHSLPYAPLMQAYASLR